MVDNGGVVIVVQDPGGFFGDDVIYGKWVPLVTPPGIVTSPSTTTASRVRTSEDGSQATVDVKLATEPTGNVVLDVASSNTAQGTVSPSSLTFTTTNWSTAQTVTLTGVDDNPDTADGGQNYTATLTVNQASTADTGYDALSAVTIYAVNLDDELGLDVGTVSGPATEAGGTATFTVKLVTDPALVFDSSESVTVSVSSRDTGEGTVSPPSLAFTAGASGTWNTAQTVTVRGVDDDVDDGDVSWDVRLDTSSADGSDYDAVSDVDVEVTTSDDEAAPSVTLSVNPTSVSENGGTSTVTATLSGKSSAATTVTVTPVSGAYSVGSGAAATIVIPAGATTSTDTATVTAVNNTTDEPNRTPTVTATVTNARATADSTTMAVAGVTLTLTDDDAAPGVTLSLNPASVAENGGTSVVSATLSHPSSAPTTVTVTAVSGAFTVPSGAAGRIVIPAGATTAPADTVTITAVDNTTDEPNRTPTVTAAVTNTQGAGSVTTATLTLTDDDAAPGVTLSLNPASVSENGGTSVVSATLSHPSSAPTTVTVTAVSGAFNVPSGAAGRIVIPAGATTASSDTVTITAVDNTTDEPNRTPTVTAAVTNTQGAGSVTTATLTLTDDDAAPGVTLSINPASVAENGGTSTVSATLSHPSSAPTTVTVTAVSGAFNVPSGAAGRIVIPAGATTASSDTVTITAVDNTTDEPNRTPTVTATVANSQGAGSVTTATLTLTDNDAAPGVTLSLNPSSVSENGETSTVSATLSHPSSAPTTVTVTAVSGAFTVPSGAAGRIVIPAGATTAPSDTVTITAVDNTTDEPNRTPTVTATVANGQGAGSVTGAILTLTDDDAAPTVTLSVMPSSISENGATATVRATLSRPSSQPTTVTVTALANVYSVAPGAGATIIVAAGQTTTTDTATITAVDNAVDAADNPVTVAGTPTNGHGVGALTGASLTLTDDDVAGIVTSPTTTTASRVRTSEDGSTAAVAVTLATEPTGDVRMDVASQDTAQGTVSPAMLTFTSTNWNTAQTVTLTGVDDNPDVADGSQNYTVSLTVDTANTADANYDALSAVTIHAVNADDELGLDVGTVSGSATEAGGTATFTVRLVTDPALATQASQAVTVSVTSRDASEGRVSPPSLAFTAGASGTWNVNQTVTVTGVDDDVDDGTVTWDVRLDTSSAAGSDYHNVPDVDVAVMTEDNDNAPTVMLALSPSSIDESGTANTAAVRATLSRASSAATTVTVTAVSGFYTVGSDATVVIPAGDTAAASDTAAITAVDNMTDEPDRTPTVTATVANDRASADSTTMAVTGATLTIRDDDAAPNVTLSLNPASIAENGGTSVVSATLSHRSSAATTVTVTAVSGFYTVGSDATIVIAAGDTAAASDTAAIAAVNNDVDEPNRTATVTATLGNSQGAGGVTGATLTLTDDETLPVATLALNPASISEAGGVATVTARLSGKSSAAVTLTVAAAAGTGAVSGDFSQSGTTLTIAAGATASAGRVTVMANDNTAATGSKQVTVSATATGGNGVANPANTALTLTDDDTPQVTLALSPSSIGENGGATTVTATLDRTSAVAVTVTVSASPGSGTDFTLSSANTLTFAANATASAGVVTITAVNNDTDAPNKTVTVSGTSSDSLGLANDPSSVMLTITDDDAAPGVTLSLSNSSIFENGVNTVVSATLSHPSSAATTVTVTPVAGAFTAPPGTGRRIVFPAGNTTSSHTVPITSVDNDVDEPDRMETVTATVANDQGAGSVTAATLTLKDNDAEPTVALSVSPGSISEDGGTAAVGAVLSNPSSEPTTVTVTAVANAYSVASGAGATIVVAAGQTTSSDTATIIAVDNAVDAADSVVTVEGTATNGHGVTAMATGVSLTITDDDVAGIVTSPQTTATARVRTSEDTSTAAVAVTLATEPTGDVRIDVASSDTAQGTVSPAMLTFTATNWNTPQTVTLTGVDDDPGRPDGSQNYTVTLTVDADGTADANYDALSAATIYARNLDDEAGVEVSPTSGLVTTEGGGTATFTVRLLSAPEGDVTVPLVSSDPGEGTVSPSSLVFTATNATTAQTVVVTGVDDEVDDGDEPYRIGTGDPSSPDDPAYDGLGAGDVDDVDVVNRDDDATPEVALVLDPASISEKGGVSRVTATLSHPSSAGTTVTVAAVAGAYTLSAATTLTIAAGEIGSTGVVTVTAVDNAVDAPDAEVTVSATAENARAAADGETVAVAGAALTIEDDDERGLALARAGDPEFAEEPVLDVDAGAGGVSYTVALTSEPRGAVTVSISGDNADDVTVTPPLLSFTAADWQEGQTVTVRAVADDDEEADAAVVLAHVARGGGYDGVTEAVTVAVAEAGDTRVAALEPGTEATYRVGDRRIVVETASAADAEDEDAYREAVEGFVLTRYEVVGDAPGGVLRLTVAPVSDEARTRMERGAYGWGEFGFGYSEQAGSAAGRMALDVEAEGMRLGFCLRITAGVHTGAAGSALVLLHHDGSVWTVVEGSGEDDDGTHVCASGVEDFSSFAVGWENEVPSWAGVEPAKRGPYVAGEKLPEDLGLPGLLPENVGDAPVRYELVGPEGAPLPEWLGFDDSGKDEEVEEGAGCSGEVERALCGRPPAEMTLELTLVAIDRHEDRTEPGLAVEIAIEEDLAPTFGGAMVEAQVYTLEEAIEPLLLPEASGGNRFADGTLDYTLAPALPRGLVLDEEGGGACGAARTVCGTPAEVVVETVYTWSAEDRDGDATVPPVRFTIEVEEGRRKARARLRRINESILPEVSRASWDSAMAAVAGRLETSAGGGGSGASGEGLATALAGFVQANEQALEDDASWKETLSGQSFAVALGGGEGEGGAGTGLGRSVTVWGAGDRRHLSRDEPWLEWSGDLSAFHLGADAAFGAGLTGGFGVSWFESRMDYVDRSEDEAIGGVHRSRMASVQPYVGWSSGEGARLWASVGYGSGEIEIDDEDLVERFGRQRSGSALVAAAAGGSVRLTSGGATRLELKGEGQATRYEVDENGDLIEGLTVQTRRVRVTAQGSREYVLGGGGRLLPLAEFGVRWDGGDGATGTGVEVGGGVSWTGPGRLVLEAGGRWLVAHRSGVEEWGLTGGLRLAPRANGRGLSLSVAPGWGEAGSGVSRLWEEGVAGRGGLGGEDSGVGVKAEVGYGVGAFGGFGVATPYTRFEQAREGKRRYGLGWRLDRRPGDGFALDLGVWRQERDTARPDHGMKLELRLKW